MACAAVTCLAELAGDAAIFDPITVASKADAMERMWTRPRLREELVQRGRARLRLFDPDVAAHTYRALYRMVGGLPLTESDRTLLRAAQQRGAGLAEVS